MASCARRSCSTSWSAPTRSSSAPAWRSDHSSRTWCARWRKKRCDRGHWIDRGEGMSRTGLRASLIWRDEVMEDLVLDTPRSITIGPTRRTTFIVPEIGLPPRFAIVRPGKRGYLLTLGERMRGTICVDGRKQDVADLVRRDSAGGFCATPIRGRDWGVIDLDESGDYKLFFQFVQVDDPPQFFTRPVLIAGGLGYLISSAALTLLWYWKGIEIDDAVFRGAGLAALGLIGGAIGWSLIRQDGESQASLAFSV